VRFDELAPGSHPGLIYPPYKSTVKRGPALDAVRIHAPASLSTNLAAPRKLLLPHDADLTAHGEGQPLGEKTDDDGRYRFVTIKPGAYPWGNHDKAWRPAHIHFSLFGNVYAQRLVTQMYFPGDPLFAYDPIYQSIADAAARARLVSRFSMDHTVGTEMLGYEFDIVLRGRDATPMGL
jgi:protocatechuate 3,4-dioxygenase beta subunit